MEPKYLVEMFGLATCVLTVVFVLGCVLQVTCAIIAVCESIVKMNEAQVAAMDFPEWEVVGEADDG